MKQKFICIVLMLSLVFCTLVSPVSAIEVESETQKISNSSQNEVICTYTIPVQTNYKEKVNTYIYFEMTRSTVTWRLTVFDPWNWNFDGVITICDESTGYYYALNYPMEGTSGIFTYNGAAGHMLHMSFSGDLYFVAHG